MCYNIIMKWIFLSPHLDDVVYSCGGFVWDLTNAGQDVEVWTICGTDPPPDRLSPFAASLHNDWGLAENAYQIRRAEDQAALGILGAQSRHLPFLDCIYRQSSGGGYLYDSEQAIFGGLDVSESGLIDELTTGLDSELPGDYRVVAPLGIGNHVDHELTRKAANRLSQAASYYADYPYARTAEGREILSLLSSSDEWSAEIFPVSEEGIERWLQASRAYESQLSIFWENEGALENEIRLFADFLGGMKVWKTIPEE
jgi:LmbE family N-acetylglucosaminyl deacetylase